MISIARLRLHGRRPWRVRLRLGGGEGARAPLEGAVAEKEGSVSHSREEETPEARWFQSLPLAERMRLLCEFTDLALEVNPGLMDAKDAQPMEGRVQVLRAP